MREERDETPPDRPAGAPETLPAATTRDDRAELVRRAIREVATAERLGAQLRADQDRWRAEAARRTADGLGRRAEREQREEDESRRTLRSATAAFARQLRADGEPPERMLVLVKSVLRDVPLPQAPEDRARLHDDVVRWSIRAYYAAG